MFQKMLQGGGGGSYGKCIFICSNWKGSKGTNNSLLGEGGILLIDNEYLNVSVDTKVNVIKPFKAKIYLLTRTGSNSKENTYATLNNNENMILSTNDGQSSIGKAASTEVSFEAGDIMSGILSANGTVTVHSVLIFV